MLQGGFTEVLRSRDRDEFRGEVVAFSKRLGFDTVSATVVIDHMLADAEFITVDNTPQEYKDTFESRENGRRDPVMQHCKRQSVPIIWGQGTYVKNGLGDMWEEQARFGLNNGSARQMPLFSPRVGTSSSGSNVTGRCRSSPVS